LQSKVHENTGKKKMNAHILITDETTHDTVVKNSFWALKFSGIKPKNVEAIIDAQFQNTKKPYYAMLCDFFSLSEGDLIFFYKRQVGFFGIYKIKGEPFFDNTPYGSINEHFPIRVKLECINYFEKPVPEELIFSTKEYESRFWVWFYRKIQGSRGVNTITPESAESMIELLIKINGNSADLSDGKPYPEKNAHPVILPLNRNGESTVFIEDALRYYIIRHIKKDNLTKVFGKTEDIEWYANNVPYHVSGKNIDILVYHKNMRYTGYPLRYQYSVVELKRDKATDKTISQVIDYSKWVSSRLANSEIETVQPIVIAHEFADTAIQKSKMIEFNNRKVLLFRYSVVNKTDIALEKIEA